MTRNPLASAPTPRRHVRRRYGGPVTAAIAAAALATVLAGCGGSSTSGSNDSGTTAAKLDTASVDELHKIFGAGGKQGGSGVTISAGMLLAVTGQGSFFGEVMSSGAKLAAAQVKAADGIDYQIHIADHKSGDVPAALSGTRQLVSRDGIKVLQTSYGAPSEAIVPIIAQNKLLSFNGGGSSPGQVAKPFLWQTRMIFGDDPTPGMLAWLNQKYPNAKRLAIVGTQENGVLGRTEIAPRVWTQLTKGQVVDSEVHDVGATDFSALIARVKSSNPDVIVTYSFGNDPGYLVKQLREANVTAPVMGIEYTDQAAKIAGAAYDTYNFATDYYDANNPNPWNKIFVKGYRDAYGKDPEYYGANYYEQVFWTWQLVQRVIAKGGDPTDTAQLQAALEANPTFPSLYGGTADQVGQVKFDVKEHTISKPMAVFKVQNGKPVQLQAITKLAQGADPKTALTP